ncbi:related to Tip elongation protein 1 [Cephalotrichum gorgonifer]|uniref:Related to Tip elongation protein 1 n=1 Tax=Cephalotrichum gorgonifer TaxID=2041049 RepID=A0AAE8SRD9_9PEZI|nr:related to Tip elongation protein 1 [Cephalotrichum gorgonifer]
MATTTTFPRPTSKASIHGTIRRPPSRQRTLRKSTSLGPGIVTSSTPNLNSLFNSYPHSQSRPPPVPRLGLSRKGSLATLTQSSLASIPDASESYGFDTVLNDTDMPLPPLTPGRYVSENVAVGDIVDVPGGMQGTVRFIGPVQGKKGTFAGVELLSEFAARGKNNGDVDGVSYFTPSVPGAGMFLPAGKAVRRESSFSLTPTGISGGLKVGTQNSTNHTPPMPSIPKFSQSVGPGRAPSPYGRKPRASLPRPDSPQRRIPMTPGPRPSMGSPSKSNGASRYGSPTTPRFAQSVRGTAGDPAKKMPLGRGADHAGLAPRSVSALGFDDEDATPTGLARPKANGSHGSVSSIGNKFRPPSRANNNDETELLRAQLEDRDRQLKEQTTTLAEMESSLAELQTLMDQSGGPRFGAPDPDEDKDTAQLRALLREKNEKIAMLTAEFDSHRADFRSTIDALEMASTETVRVYESQKKEMMQEVQELTSRLEDVDSVASQLKQLEDLVQDLEEGLEDARRGEAEARGEVEFLRGEVERTRAELRREKEKTSSSALNRPANGNTGGDPAVVAKEVEQKDDEIRGLKAIIHSLSRDSAPNEGDKSMEQRRLREKWEREIADLRAVLEEKTKREEEMEQELDMLRRPNATQRQSQRQSALTVVSAKRSSLRDSRDTVVLSRNHEPRSPPEAQNGHTRVRTLDTMPESDAYSTATENSTLWCEICETGGHDILTCTNMFGPDGAKSTEPYRPRGPHDDDFKSLSADVPGDIKISPLSTTKSKAALVPDSQPTPRVAPSLMDSGPLAGKESGVVDETKWCALCERDGHDSVDCPIEDAF